MTEAALFLKMKNAEEQEDVKALDLARREYLKQFPAGKDATEIRFRLGLSTLLLGGNVAEAASFFKDATAEKNHPIAKEARISFALCLNAQKKRQQALFELRKLLPAGVLPSPNTASALEFLSLILRESGAKGSELDDVEERRREHLRSLADAESEPSHRAQYLFRLVTAFLDTGNGPDGAQAKKILNEIIKLGPAAKDEVKKARAELKTISTQRR